MHKLLGLTVVVCWAQDFANWNSPAGATPWPTSIFFSYYLTDTNRENGCLRVVRKIPESRPDPTLISVAAQVPGSHLRCHALHDLLPNAHETEIQSLNDLDSPVFANHPDAIDVPMAAGDLIIGGAQGPCAELPERFRDASG